jgi:hypothetical protein
MVSIVRKVRGETGGFKIAYHGSPLRIGAKKILLVNYHSDGTVQRVTGF